MARISTYPLDTAIVGTDKWIGTDAASFNATKNFTVSGVAESFNASNTLSSYALKFRFQDSILGIGRLTTGSISFLTDIGSSVPFSGVTTFMLSKNQLISRPASSFYTSPLVGAKVLISDADDVSQFGIFSWDSAAVDVMETNFFNIGLTYIEGFGSLIGGKEYYISLLTYGSSSGGSSVSMTQVEVDFGDLPVSSQEFTISDATAVSTSNISAAVAYEAPTGKQLDEVTMDNLQIRCGQPSAGSFKMFIDTAGGSYLAGYFKINYTITLDS